MYSKVFIFLTLFILLGARNVFSVSVVPGSYSDTADEDVFTAILKTYDNIQDKAAATSVTYKKITSVDQLIIGEKYIIVCESGKAVLGLIERGMGNSVSATISKGVAKILSENSKDNPYEITLGGSSGSYVLKTEQGTLGWKIDNEFNTDGTYNLWNITFNEKGDAIFYNVEKKYGILYNKYIGKFLTYAQSNTEHLKCQLYKKESHEAETGTITITSAKYTTFYSEKAFVMPAEIAGGVITAANKETGDLIIDYRYTEGKTVPAKTGLLIKGEAGKYSFNYDASCTEAPIDGNMLHATVDASGLTNVEGENVMYYKLSYNKEGKNLGFYWGEENGAPFKNKPPHAYLAIDGVMKVSSMFILDNEKTTNISNVESKTEAQNRIYTITGICLDSDYTNLPKGIYIKNGTKIIKH